MQESLALALTTLLAYLLGSIPTAYIVGRLTRNIDIRSVGSRNSGALNTFHHVGPRSALVVLGTDALKGALAILLAIWIGDSLWYCFAAGLAVVAGHNWPLFLGFRGGKGAATLLGVSLAVLPIPTLVALIPAILVTYALRNLVLGAAVGFILVNVLAVTTGQDWRQVFLCLLLTSIVTGTYVGRSWRESATALHRRRWLDLASFE